MIYVFSPKLPLPQVRDELLEKGWPILEGIVERTGALGKMDSLYLRDPDGNLVELSHYREEAPEK